MQELEAAADALDVYVSGQEEAFGSSQPQEKWILPFDDESDDPSSVPWTTRNVTQIVPLIPQEIMWLMDKAEERLRNASGIPFALNIARRLAAFNSVAYCSHNNIAAWNCTR